MKIHENTTRQQALVDKTVNMDTMPLRWGHLRVWMVASMGQLMGGALSTLVGVVIPLMQALSHTHLSSLAQGLLASMSLMGIMAGSLLIGSWSDHQGYLRYLRLSPLLIFVGALIALWSIKIPWLMIALFTMGFGVGGGYSLDSDYISEIMPQRWRLFMVGAAKATSAVGNIVIAFICFLILKHWQIQEHWKSLFSLIALLAAVMFLASIRFKQSPGWLLSQGRVEEARHAVHYFLGKDVEIGEISNHGKDDNDSNYTWRQMFQGKNLQRAILCGIPWACEGYGVYGIGVFLPTLIMALGVSEGDNSAIGEITSSVELSAYMNIFVVVGFMLGLSVVKRSSHTKQQSWGFALCAIGLAIVLAGSWLKSPHWVMIAGIIIFELFINFGPHLITFILPPQIYPIAERGAGAGLAAAMGKAGAVIGVFTTPLVLKWGGTNAVLAVTLALQLIGAIITATLGRKILGKTTSP
ncbi:MAG: MFS transporter [Alistipes sp.]|nr:MFS transporter [Alistipes sp.]